VLDFKDPEMLLPIMLLCFSILNIASTMIGTYWSKYVLSKSQATMRQKAYVCVLVGLVALKCAYRGSDG